MRDSFSRRCFWSFLVFIAVGVSGQAQPQGVESLVAALLGETPLEEDVQELTDVVGGRPTGSAANLRSVDWAVSRFQEAGVTVAREAFRMPALWVENAVRAEIQGDVQFPVRAVAMPFSSGTPETGIRAPLVDLGSGSQKEFDRLGERVRDAFVLVETMELTDLAGLFREYGEAARIEKLAFSKGVRGVVYMSSRSHGLLYRHVASLGMKNRHPLLIVEREQAQRLARLLRAGKNLELKVQIDVRSGGEYTSYNVIGEMRGSEAPEEIVIVGAHLDSWGLGTGANDNGCNVAMMIDIARQIRRLGLAPRRTIRFALWNGEEQGMVGSWRYTLQHEDELDRHIAAISIDIGSGRLKGFFTNGRPEVFREMPGLLKPVGGLGPFQNVDAPIVGTDNFDFLLQGVANLVGNQEDANYGPTYHAESDTFDKVDLRQLRLNTAVVAAVVWGLADSEIRWTRQTRSDLQRLMEETDLKAQLRSMGFLDAWEQGLRGRQ